MNEKRLSEKIKKLNEVQVNIESTVDKIEKLIKEISDHEKHLERLGGIRKALIDEISVKSSIRDDKEQIKEFEGKLLSALMIPNNLLVKEKGVSQHNHYDPRDCDCIFCTIAKSIEKKNI